MSDLHRLYATIEGLGRLTLLLASPVIVLYGIYLEHQSGTLPLSDGWAYVSIGLLCLLVTYTRKEAKE
jgi:hypothetical protein